ncbi:hypothetical protein U9M48_016338 [Paspalum notatum var. saurae]|uniref:DUF223 domain-containing protein n=1 Tax=Paspalum notatum var. saurae TaxID=547442 RepID=A0AAQ3T6C8_PASNO
MQANITPVSDLRPGRIDYTIHVRISRMWEFRGPNEENDLRHLDLILIDQKYIRRTDRFLDVIGKITGVSNAAKVYNTSGDPMMRRVIRLQDLMGNVIELSLSGKGATEFPAEAVLDVGQKHHVIAIFVGTLMKLYRDEHRFLSETSACRWIWDESQSSTKRNLEETDNDNQDPDEAK